MFFTASGALHLAQWLPDSQRILFTRDLPRINRQRIGVFNPFTSQFTPHAERNFNGNRPLWLPEHDTVAYLDWGFNEQSQGRVSYTLITDHRSLITEISSPFFALTVEERLIFSHSIQWIHPSISNSQSPISNYRLPITKPDYLANPGLSQNSRGLLPPYTLPDRSAPQQRPNPVLHAALDAADRRSKRMLH